MTVLSKKRIKDRRRVDDHYARKAKRENYAARSVYKLKEADDKYKLLAPGGRVLDLGCAPGSWTQYAAEKVGPSGLVVGVDRTPVEGRFSDQVRLLTADVHEIDPADLTQNGLFDLVLSDMAPKTTGNKHVDQARSLDLVESAWRLGQTALKEGGGFLFKVFQSQEAEDFIKRIRPCFDKMTRIKPQSSRSYSYEIFGLGMGYRHSE